jgi:hypothetical protein
VQAETTADPGDAEWPDESDESQFLGAAAGGDGPPDPGSGPPAAAEAGERPPPLEELVARVPADIRAVLDDLFRARFTGVRRFAPTPTDAPR